MSQYLLKAPADLKLSLMSLFTYFKGDDAGRSVLPFIPRPIRILFILVLIINTRSLPFAWHLRVFRPIILARLKWAWLRLTFASQQRKDAFIASLSSFGKSPFELRMTYKTWVSPDDTDYNIHLSNSCYSKLLDIVRTKFALAALTPTFREGCWIALGATHARFIREIPSGKNYEVRVYTGAWDDKWVYVVSRFVSKNSKSKKKVLAAGTKKVIEGTNPSSDAVPFPDMHTPASGDVSIAPSGTSTPNPNILIHPPTSLDASDDAQITAALSSTSSSPDANAVLSSAWPEAEDETLHCVVVNEMCFKTGRITVPPALALAISGCGMHDGSEHWAQLQALRTSPSGKGKKSAGGNKADNGEKTLKGLLRGGWKDVPPAERWWEHALAPYAAENARRLSILKGLREDLASVHAL